MAIRFDASGDFLRRTTVLPSPIKIAACGWAVRKVDTGTFACVFAVEDSTSGATNQLMLVTDADGDSLKLYSNGFSGTTLVSLKNDQWFRWALSINGAGAGLGVAYFAPLGAGYWINSGIVTSATFTSANLELGNSSSSDSFNGSLLGVKVWDRPMSAADLWQETRQILPIQWHALNSFAPLVTSPTDTSPYAGRQASVWTIGGTLAAEGHPPIPWQLPSRRVWDVPAAAAGGSFQPAWAFGASQLLSGGYGV